MVIALHAYGPIKQLCAYCRRNSNSFRLINAQTVAIISGVFSGMIVEFKHDCCRVKIGHSTTCFDWVGDFSADLLVRLLYSHSLIKIYDLDIGD
jgi:hypothetical protein